MKRLLYLTMMAVLSAHPARAGVGLNGGGGGWLTSNVNAATLGNIPAAGFIQTGGVSYVDNNGTTNPVTTGTVIGRGTAGVTFKASVGDFWLDVRNGLVGSTNAPATLWTASEYYTPDGTEFATLPPDLVTVNVGAGTAAALYPESITNFWIAAHADIVDGSIDLSACTNMTTIGDWAFGDCPNLTSITIPNSVTSIGNAAFANDAALTSITIPNSVTTIGGHAFSYCVGLTNVVLGTGLVTIGGNAFDFCAGLTSITIPNSVTTIGGAAFSYCVGLTNVVLGTGLVTIGYEAFAFCTGLTNVNIRGCSVLTNFSADAFSSITPTSCSTSGASSEARTYFGNLGWTLIP